VFEKNETFLDRLKGRRSPGGGKFPEGPMRYRAGHTLIRMPAKKQSRRGKLTQHTRRREKSRVDSQRRVGEVRGPSGKKKNRSDHGCDKKEKVSKKSGKKGRVKSCEEDTSAQLKLPSCVFAWGGSCTDRTVTEKLCRQRKSP